ncbi:tumor necrosis factor receptor superfamily member 5 isoform X2 [Sardina pilchardus]|uniref:tumor necrosis factor receptor superfamily member 5 isoform X2 n=1 Tax=Sardina pilchardus TaxID=27697 RepID=UPI002E1448BA
MGASLFFAIQLILMAHQTFLLPLNEGCRICEPGSYQASCSTCAPCPPATYTKIINKETQCHPCSRDCKPEFNMEVIEACSSKSNVRCRCMAGFTCTKTDSGICSRCDQITMTKTCEKGSYFSDKHCKKHKNCTADGLEVQTPGNTTHDTICKQPSSLASEEAAMQWQLPLVVICVAVFAFLVLFALSYSHREGEGACLKQLLKNCFPGSDKAAMNEAALHKPKGPVATGNYQDTHSDSLPSANYNSPASSQPGTLGPLYINHPSTVFVSLLNQFGLGGGGEGGAGGGGREEERYSPNPRPDGDETHSPPSPIPLSTEERSREEETSVPSQEQGKESHMSKEEEL